MDEIGKPVVVILGGGFAGLAAARSLAKIAVRVIIVDKSNHHTFQPLLYQVATAGLSPAQIAAPIRSLVRDCQNVEVLLAEAVAIDSDNNRVVLADDEIKYDYLIVATGVTHSYFGHHEWEKYAPGLKSLQDSLELRRRILWAFERAERLGQGSASAAYTTFVVVGGGPTGVELAGAIAELARHSMAADFRRISPALTRVILLEAGDRLLPAFSSDLSTKTLLALQDLGVEVRLNCPLTSVNATRVEAGGQIIEARTVIWAAGVAATPILSTLAAVERDKSGRIMVAEDLRASGRVFVVGDAAAVRQADGTMVPGVAPAALQMGKHVAKNIALLCRGKQTVPFRYLDKGNLATIGRTAAVAQFGPLHLSGLMAWIVWVFVHIFFLIGFKNRLTVLLDWLWSYLTFARSSRLIIGEPRTLPRFEGDK